jgi:hypothetical protein
MEQTRRWLASLLLPSDPIIRFHTASPADILPSIDTHTYAPVRHVQEETMNGRLDKKALVGCIVMGGLALAAVVLHVEPNALPDLWPFHHDEVSVTGDTKNVPRPIANTPTVAARDDTSDADIAFVLQAVSDDLQRNDLTAAKVLLDEVLAVHSDLPRALALQQELRSRELKAAHATAPAPVAASDSVLPPVAMETRETKVRAPGRKHEGSVRSKQVASHGATHVKSGRPSGVAQNKHPVTVSKGRPKTRAEVVAELKRARANGAVPNYGGRHR